jgi:ElaB/YqjD/DUF883 family membrane-anchored ribosome-binding protein
MNSDLQKDATDEMEKITERIREGIDRGKYTWSQVQESVSHATRDAARTTDDYVHENAWKSIGMAAVLGLLIGLLLPRR